MILPVVDDGQPIAQALGLVHVVCGQQHGAAALLKLANDLPQAGGGSADRVRWSARRETEFSDCRPARWPPPAAASVRRRACPPWRRPSRSATALPVHAPSKPDADRSWRTSFTVSRTVSFSDSRVSCSEMPSNSRSSRSCPCQVMPRISTSPDVGASSPSRISMVVVLPAPFGPSNPKHSPGRMLEIESPHRLDLAVVGLLQALAADGGFHTRNDTEESLALYEQISAQNSFLESSRIVTGP